MPDDPGSLPKVSIVLPTLNERAFIRDCLDSLVGQDYPSVQEILVVDGGSSDGTTAIAEGIGGVVRVVPNPRVTAAAGMNIGIERAAGEVIVRADAHAVYAPDFVSRSVEALESSGAAVVGGPMRPVGLNRFGRAVAAVTSSPFGIGPGRFHYASEAQEVETVYLGAYRRETVLEVGGYDELNLQWAAEDQELNYRIRRGGGRIRVDPTVRSFYFPRDTPRSLWRQYFNYGVCKASTLSKHRTLPYWRPLVPAALVATTVGALVVGTSSRKPVIAVAPLAAWFAGASVVALDLTEDPGVAPQEALVALGLCHWGYGLGFWSGVWRIFRGKPFDNRPRGHR